MTSLPVATSASGAPAEWWRAAPAPVADSRLPFVALMAFTFILILAPQTFFPVLGKFRIAMIAAVVAIASHVANRFVQGRSLSSGTREMSTAACLAAWATVTVPFSLLAWRQHRVSDGDLLQDARGVLVARECGEYAAADSARSRGDWR